MDYESKGREYAAFAIREEQAAARAATRESARLHQALGDLYRNESAKMEAMRRLPKDA